jgi:23S rRNA pseudouridine1911/1915/1917 synthase
LETKRQFIVGVESEGRRLDDFLAERVADLSRMHIAALVARGACEVNGAGARAGLKLKAGDAVELSDSGEVANSMTPERAPLEIVHEDEHIIVVVKPAGLLVHPTRGVKTGTLANALAYHLNRMRIDENGLRIDENGLRKDEDNADSHPSSNPQSEIRNPQSKIPQSFIRPGLVHRLDRDTSGLMVVAKTQAALSRLSQHFQRRLVEKRYAAVVAGRVEQDELTIVAPVGRDEDAWPFWRVTESGRHAETRLRVVERRDARTLVELEPVTGRTNQLRIHCAHAGHAIVGDTLYSGEPHARLCLHASRLAFRHPSTNERMEFHSAATEEVLTAMNSRNLKAADSTGGPRGRTF